MKNSLLYFSFVLLLACKKEKPYEHYMVYANLVNVTWKTTDYLKNGVQDLAAVTNKHSFEFRDDGKVYFSQINPVFKDTLQWDFLNEQYIKLTKPWLNTSFYKNLRIDHVDDGSFFFTLMILENTNTEAYKTYK